MPAKYSDDSQKEVEQIANALKQLDTILASDKISTMYEGDLTQLRASVKELLISIDTNISVLKDLEQRDIFGTNPSLAGDRYALIRRIEENKKDFEFDIVPEIGKLTKQAVQYAKRNPPTSVDESKLPPVPSGEKWTAQKVIDTAEEYLNQAIKAAKIVTKAYAFAKALGILAGIPLP
jgi:hypothetical protein